MLDAAKRAAELGAGAPIDEFVPDSLLTLGLTRLVEVFCEASKQVSPSFKERHTEINWREMAGTRDRLVHAYWDVDVEVLRDIVFEDLPPLVPALETLLAELEADG